MKKVARSEIAHNLKATVNIRLGEILPYGNGQHKCCPYVYTFIASQTSVPFPSGEGAKPQAEAE